MLSKINFYDSQLNSSGSFNGYIRLFEDIFKYISLYIYTDI